MFRKMFRKMFRADFRMFREPFRMFRDLKNVQEPGKCFPGVAVFEFLFEACPFFARILCVGLGLMFRVFVGIQSTSAVLYFLIHNYSHTHLYLVVGSFLFELTIGLC